MTVDDIQLQKLPREENILEIKQKIQCRHTNLFRKEA